MPPRGGTPKPPVHRICCTRIRVPPPQNGTKRVGVLLFGLNKFGERGFLGSPPVGAFPAIKIKKSILHPFRRWRLDTTAPIAPTSAVGSAHNFGRSESTSFSRPCQSCGHFQQRRSEQWAPPCVFSVIAAHFLTLFVLENLSVFPSAKKWNKTQPTTGQTSYTFGMSADIQSMCFRLSRLLFSTISRPFG